MPATSKSQHSAKTKSTKSSPSGKKHSRKSNPLLAELPPKLTKEDWDALDPELRKAWEILIAYPQCPESEK